MIINLAIKYASSHCISDFFLCGSDSAVVVQHCPSGTFFNDN
ncbi:chitin-binding domain-containing protein [Zooshikella harenae]|uniref:Chitin-binding type-2 domain-containing protein n=1 Tax=Zooshikella harenae TaxID=2827238 RepID=A0ABS5ZAA6_9GAMM|nr:hypothetical protein [Zooshikella harenae]